MLGRMGRKHRDLTQSIWFHVFNRGSDRQDIFSADADYALFEQLIAEEFPRFAIEVHAYALMTNHFHLLVRCPSAGLSDAMQRVCGRYGAAYNFRSERHGPLLGGRFGSVPVTSDEQLIAVGRYIHRNPLAFVPADRLAQYPWSSFASLCGRRVRPAWMGADAFVLGGMTRDEYRQFVLTDEVKPVACSSSDTALSELVAMVAVVCDVDPADVVTARPGRASVARMLAVTLALDLRLAPLDEVAERFGFTNLGSVRRLARRGRVASAREPRLDLQRRRVLSMLVPDRSRPSVA
jgi:putative transposase